jgi:hypothetical protein
MALDGALNSQLFIQALAYRAPVADRSSRWMVSFVRSHARRVFNILPTIAFRVTVGAINSCVRQMNVVTNSTMDIHDHPVDVAPRDSWRARATASRE